MVSAKYLFLAAVGLAAAFLWFAASAGRGLAKDDYAGMPIDETIPQSRGEAFVPSGAEDMQEVEIRALASGGYDKPIVNVKAGKPIRLRFFADPLSGCGRQILVDGTSVNLISRRGEAVEAIFTFRSPGRYSFHCAMNMFRGAFVAS